jgi:hypothetical protein
MDIVHCTSMVSSTATAAMDKTVKLGITLPKSILRNVRHLTKQFYAFNIVSDSSTGYLPFECSTVLVLYKFQDIVESQIAVFLGYFNKEMALFLCRSTCQTNKIKEFVKPSLILFPGHWRFHHINIQAPRI